MAWMTAVMRRRPVTWLIYKVSIDLADALVNRAVGVPVARWFCERHP
jgi:hypothetical protein